MLFFLNVNWSNTTFGYSHCDRILKNVDCKSNVLGYYNANGSTRTIIGTVSNQCPALRTVPPSIGNSYPIPPLAQTLTVATPTYSQNRTSFTINTTPASYTVAVPLNTREITIQNITGTDFTIASSLVNKYCRYKKFNNIKRSIKHYYKSCGIYW